MRARTLTVSTMALLLASCQGSGRFEVHEDQPAPEECPKLGQVQLSAMVTNAALGVPASVAIPVSNVCDEGLALRIEASFEGSSAFAADPPVVGLAPGEVGELVVVFTAPDYAVHNATIRLITNDPADPQPEIAIAAAASADQDGDSQTALAAGGRDCDDTDPEVYEGAPEKADLVDQDCDGLADEDFVDEGDVWISEIAARPTSVPDASGEWLELYNAGPRDLELRGWMLEDDDGPGFAIEESLVLRAGARLVLGASEDPAENGGVAVDLAWPAGALDLGDAGDTLTLSLGELVVARLAIDGSWPLTDGASIAVDVEAERSQAELRSWWCASSTVMANGERGTPGAENEWCATVDHDEDGQSQVDGDCDEADASVWTGAPELWDGVDQDCDGELDDLALPGSALGYVDGASGDYLTYFGALGAGDFDGDGLIEVAVGSVYSGGSRGAVWLLEGADAGTWSGAASTYAEASFTGNTGYYYGVPTASAGDNTGDGVVDLVIAGGDSYGGSAWGLFSGPVSTDTQSGADVRVSGYWSDYGRATSGFDMNGDGVHEVLYGGYYGTHSSSDDGIATVFDTSALSGAYDAEDADIYVHGSSASSHCGIGIAAGDLDADGYDDAIVGCHAVSSATGALYVIYGSDTLNASGAVSAEAGTTITGPSTGSYFGTEPVVADLDGDGALDLAAPASYSNAVYVFFDTTDLSGTVRVASKADLVISGSGYFGGGIAAGDVDGDGAAELAISSRTVSAASFDAVWVWDGATLAAGALADTSASVTIAAEGSADQLGYVLRFADTDADGLQELLLGAPRVSTNVGRVYIVDPQ